MSADQPIGVLETVASRWNRDHVQVRDDRTERGIDEQAIERLDRRYVNPRIGATRGQSTITGNVPPQFPGAA